MNLWNWLWGKKGENAGEMGYGASAPAQAPAPPPGMQQIQVTAPAAVPTSYGITRAIELMRALPIDEDPGLVLRVVRKTLRSTGVSLEEIVVTAKAREEAVVKGIEADRAAIEQLEIQIATRKANIVRLEADLEETRDVRGRIQEALESETQVGEGLNPQDILRIRAEADRAKKPDGQASAAPVPAPPPSTPSAAPRPPPPLPVPAPLPKKPVPVASKPPPKLPSDHGPTATSATSAAPPPPKREPPPPADSRPAPVAPVRAAPAPAKPAAATTSETLKTPVPGAPSSDAKAADAEAAPAKREAEASIPDLGEIDDAFNEPTAKRDIDPKTGGPAS